MKQMNFSMNKFQLSFNFQYFNMPAFARMVRFGSILELCCESIIADNPINRSGYVIFDNAPAHRNVESFVNLKRLPKYTPFPNPTEIAISCWGTRSLRNEYPNVQEFIDISDDRRGFDKIREILETSKAVITREKCRAWENCVFCHLTCCLTLKNIGDDLNCKFTLFNSCIFVYITTLIVSFEFPAFFNIPMRNGHTFT